MPFDKDLTSIQEVRDALVKAKAAQLEFKNYSQEQVDKIVKAMVDAGVAESARLGRLACDETGFGKPEDKQKKNEFSTKRVWESIKDLKTVGVVEVDETKKIYKIAEPMGVVAALIPSTNPTSTAMFKAIISVKARNACVASPHPRAVHCTNEAINVVRDAAERAGAPKHLIACLGTPAIEGTNELMRHKLTAVILATGSNQMVKAAYSSGKPAFGVGSGNVPAFIERTANIKKAVADIISGKQFDYGVLCSTESALVCDAPIKNAVVEECKKRGAYFVAGDEKDRLARLMFSDRGAINPDMVGKSPEFIAQKAGISVPANTTVLIAEMQGVGREYPLSREKLSPVLSFYTEDGWRNACHRCIELLEFGGIGHTLVIHSKDHDIIMKFALEKPAMRILANTQAALGAVGYTNGLDPSMTLGPGTWGGSIISENVTARHLMNIKRLAFETHPINPDEVKYAAPASPQQSLPHTIPASWMDEIDKRIIMKAGNTPVWQKEEPPAPHQYLKPPEYGSGISAEEIDRIVRTFTKDRS
ncbi:MAG: aldehyde dehydrogenase family protein [Bacteroidetes bacterium]|nr:aldehyde dehydrogenase family protein [Bacteroidota bacterium]MCW5895064.1 aldehyde dehydrogenase family protein [Bacteroidota bacterium]